MTMSGLRLRFYFLLRRGLGLGLCLHACFRLGSRWSLLRRPILPGFGHGLRRGVFGCGCLTLESCRLAGLGLRRLGRCFGSNCFLLCSRIKRRNWYEDRRRCCCRDGWGRLHRWGRSWGCRRYRAQALRSRCRQQESSNDIPRENRGLENHPILRLWCGLPRFRGFPVSPRFRN